VVPSTWNASPRDPQGQPGPYEAALTDNHPLQYDAAYHVLLVGGKSGIIESYSRDGRKLGSVRVQDAVDQCDLNQATHELACAGSGKVTIVRESPGGALTLEASLDAAHVHTLAFDEKTDHVWIVWADTKGDFVQELSLEP